MTFLPIVERELRVAARRASTYWMRFLAGLAVMVIWLVLLVGSRVGSPAQLGHHLFNALGVLALGFSMFAGVFLTSDCLSEEKREGTMGLLFLTDLKGYDVVMGKLAAASVHAFFGLLAIFPILGLPLMMGGVTGTEFWRLALVLTVTLFLSLALGIFASSVSYESRHSTSRALLLMVLFAGIFPALWWLQSILVKVRFLDPLLLPSPGYAYLRAFDSSYRLRNGPVEFWRALCTLLGLGLGCIGLATLILPRVWQQGSPAPSTNIWLNALLRLFRRRRGGKEKQRSIPVHGNPYLWLASRESAPRLMARVLTRVLIPIWLAFLIASVLSAKHQEAFTTCVFIAYGMHLVVKVLMALEASRRMSEDRVSGALELLLVTPLPISTILDGHRAALAKLFRRPVLILILVNLAMMATVLWFSKPLDMDGEDRAIFCELFLGGILMLWLDFSTLTWVGMWTGLNAKRHHRAAVSAIGKVMGLPWVAVFLEFFLERGMNRAWQVAATFASWFALGMVVDLVLRSRARKKLQREFRSAALRRFG